MKPFSKVGYLRLGLILSLAICSLLWACGGESMGFHPRQVPSTAGLDLEPYTHRDSMLEVFGNISNTRSRLDSLFFYIELLRSYNGDTAMAYAQEAYRLATLNGLELQKGVSLYYMALIKRRTQEFGDGTEDALADAHIGRSIFQQIKNTYWETMLYTLISILHQKKEQYDSMELYLNLAHEIINDNESKLEQQDSSMLIGEVLHSFGNLYFDNSDFEKAMEYFQKSMKNYQLNYNKAALARLQIDIGRVFINKGKLKQAQNILDQSLEYSLSFKDKNNLIDVYRELGNLKRAQYKQTKDEKYFKEAIYFFKKQLNSFEENKYKAYEKLAFTFHSQAFETGSFEDVDSALFYYQKAMISASNEGEIRTLRRTALNIGDLCKSKREEQKEPKINCDSILGTYASKFITTNYNQAITPISSSMAEADKELDNYQRNIIEAEAARGRRNQLLVAGLILLFTVLFFLIIAQRLQQNRLKAKMESLRAQINPHFISNSLNAIESLVNMDKKEAASKYLIHFSRLSRRILNGSRSANTTLKNELETLKHFLALEQLRFRDKLQYEIVLDKHVNLDRVIVPTMILQPYVENAIWHGIKPKNGVGHLRIEAKKTNNQLICIVEDDGIGREKSRNLQAKSVLKHKSLGMQITQERLNANKRIKGSRLQIEDLYTPEGEAQGTRVTVRLPYKLKKT